MDLPKIIELFTDNYNIDFANDVVVEFNGYKWSVQKWHIPQSQPTIDELTAFYNTNKTTIDTIEKNKQDIQKIDRLIQDATKIRSNDNLRFALVVKKKALIATNNNLKDSLLR